MLLHIKKDGDSIYPGDHLTSQHEKEPMVMVKEIGEEFVKLKWLNFYIKEHTVVGLTEEFQIPLEWFRRSGWTKCRS